MAPQNRFEPKKFKDMLAAEGKKVGVQFHDPLVVRFISDRGDFTLIISWFPCFIVSGFIFCCYHAFLLLLLDVFVS